ncbi:polysaccharide pyruvyl transferase family protein [Gloeocapsopsis crepidinum LEGE 06123]|uniref:Polysaccharide pyruvyl transferase family protein n=1 Tax=Gloeocapsopsis crepidinum LEGE 06123 TaxID=588587 RepID=A0ABR9UQG1_9CHRO|nr:polysaccharide pyruvyl transferase family protein [Gloeocapsopsis crepidinum]MBE9190506.1 polysaccharide pyruvyl transferase family protein [Gloeocapsopsis crepidinum LEGE 06123]
MQLTIKTQILFQLLSIYAATLGFLRKTKVRSQIDASALFLPPSDPGSIGDEAMLAASMEHLAAQGIQRIGIITLQPTARWENLKLVTDTINIKGFFTRGSWWERFRLVEKISRYEHFYCLGADVMDGFYSDNVTLLRLNLVALAAKTGADATILGFSFNHQPTDAAVQSFSQLPASVRLCCRDPISYQRIKQCLQRPVELVADLAFMLQPAEDSDLTVRVSKWVRAQKAQGRIVLGVNANALHLTKVTRLKRDEFIQFYANAFINLCSRNQKISLLMIPHDFRGDDSDVSIAQAILEAMPSAIKPYCMQVPTPCSAAEIKSICADLDLVLTGRMHLAIACLGQGIPVGGVTYQGKFEGLFRHFELPGMTIDPEKAFQPGVLTDFLIDLIAKREDIHQQIQSHLANVKVLSVSNFERKPKNALAG